MYYRDTCQKAVTLEKHALHAGKTASSIKANKKSTTRLLYRILGIYENKALAPTLTHKREWP